ncbi:MAG TPA: TonB-dependent receptor, partial [Bacteroidota bacterium]|nr:TonB-dependent receptor [Bacteroidota bacterium]
KYNENYSRLYDDPTDPRYVHPDSLNVSGYHYRVAGTNLNRFARNTKSIIAKWDITSQIDKHNLPKVGIEVQADDLSYENITLVPAKTALGREIVPFIPSIDGVESTNHDLFQRTPFKVSAYAQDKIELDNMIINIGLRLETFDPNGKTPVDPSDPDIYNPFKLEHRYHDLNGDGQIGLAEEVASNAITVAERETYWYKKASRKTSLSPRLGIAYPITDKGIIRFSYGIFEQIPEYSQLYQGDQYKLVSAQQGVQGPYGNNDLKPQRSTIYEIGLQQQMTDNIAVDVTGFYRDIRDWISSSQPIPTFLAGLSYSQRINRDFANVRGITLSVKRRWAQNFSFGIDYTFQVADGTNSTPDQEFYAQQNGQEPTKTLAPLSWDQTHTLNGNIFIGNEQQGISIIAAVSSGQPYTPTRLTGSNTGKNVMAGLVQNSGRKPYIARFDVEAFKNFSFSGVDVQLFVRAFNVFDRKNPINVFGDTGLADYTLQQVEISGYDKGWFDLPTNFSEPRSVYLGTKISL